MIIDADIPCGTHMLRFSVRAPSEADARTGASLIRACALPGSGDVRAYIRRIQANYMALPAEQRARIIMTYRRLEPEAQTSPP